MKTNTIKLSLATLLVNLMCFSVVLAHLHAKDAVSLLNQPGFSKFANTDITVKAIGDLHHHIDKASLKNIHTDTSTTAARVRELKPLIDEQLDAGLMNRLHDFMLRLRVVASLCFQAV